MLSNRLIPALVLLLIVTGCTTNKTLRTSFDECEMSGRAKQCAQHAIEVHRPGTAEEFRLGFVEVDDQGQFRDRGQLDAVLDDFRGTAGKEDVLMVTFVHGWHHGAGFGDDNVKEFRKLLGNLAIAEAKTHGRRVLGLYLGWRGESVPIPGFRYLTFWDRKSTAHEVGGNGATEVFLKLEEIANVKAGTSSNTPNRSRLVVIGHSFGGAIVFQALQQIMEDRFIDSRRGKTFSSGAEGFGDLVLLVNPAFEALRFASLHDLSRSRCSYFPGQLPKLAILTSEADRATGLAFPLGRSFSTFLETHNTIERRYCHQASLRYSEGSADRNTVGHFQPFVTHELRPLKLEAKTTGSEPKSFRELSRVWTGRESSEEIILGDLSLVHRGTGDRLNPYLNIRVDADLIPSHSDIWDPRIVTFVSNLITLSTEPEGAPK